MNEDDLPEDRGGPEPEQADLDTARDSKLFGPGDFHNVEAEAALLGALMIDNRLVGDVSQMLKDAHFYEPLHGKIFHAMVRMVGNGKVATPVTLRPIFEHDPDMKELGGPAYLAQLTGSGAAIIGARDFANQVVELARMRRLYGAMIVTVRAFQETGEIAAATDRLEREIWAAADVYRPVKIRDAGAMIGLVQERNERITEAATATTGVTSKTLPEITAMLGGLEPQMMTLLAGRPSMGKTTTAVSFAWGCAANGHPVFYPHAESSGEMMALKVAADISYDLGDRIPFERVRDGKLTKGEIIALEEAKAQAKLLPLRFADCGRIDIARLDSLFARECAYWESRGRRLELGVVDYLQLIGVEGERDQTKRVGILSKALLDMAKKYGFHMMALAQLSRKVEDRVATDRRPQLSDLKDSGDLEQDADNVVFVHRPEFYLVDQKPKAGSKGYESAIIDWESDMAEWSDKAELIGAKTRFGKRTSKRVKFLGDYSAVRSLMHRRLEPDDEEDQNLFMAGGSR